MSLRSKLDYKYCSYVAKQIRLKDGAASTATTTVVVVLVSMSSTNKQTIALQMKLLRHLRSEFAHLHILYYCSLNLSLHFSYRVIGLQNLHLDDGSVEALMSQELLQSLKLRATMPQRDGMYVCLSYPVGFFGCCLFFYLWPAFLDKVQKR